MASVGKVFNRVLRFSKNYVRQQRLYGTSKDINNTRVISVTCICVAGGGLALYVANKWGKLNTVYAWKPKRVSLLFNYH